jgi:nucleotide-binding universal stress UspA family protein
VIFATDGAAPARAALRATLAFPWPPGTRVRGTVASQPFWLRGRPKYVQIAVARSFERLVARTRQALSRRWPDAEVVTVSEAPPEAILREATRFSADVIVVGWRGHGAFRRLFMGSVSRTVVQRATSSVLVVRRSPREIRQVVIGVDGSPKARRAVELAALLKARRGAQVTVVGVAELMAIPTAGLLPAPVRATVRHGITTLNAGHMRHARREVQRAATRLRRAGWRVRMEVRSGAPLAELLNVVERSRGDLLIVGVRATRGLERAVLGSVAEGALNRSPVPVLVVR